jgi:anti-sigma factor RsiW
MQCEEARLLLQAELDGELDAAGAAPLAAHVQGCAACARERQEMAALSRRLRALPRYAAPAALRAGLGQPWWRRRAATVAAGFAPGFALAAGLALAFMPRGEDLSGQLVQGHLRALQANHLLDIAATDQHQVKPWFLGKLDYAPPVREPQGFPLLGGRLDYLGGQAVAALVYRSAEHSINLYVLPEAAADAGVLIGQRNGFNLRRWRAGGMVLWAVSDVSADGLAAFERAWRATP